MKPPALGPCSLQPWGASRGGAHLPSYGWAEFFSQLCFLSCSQYTLPQIHLASFFILCCCCWVMAPLLLVLAWAVEWTGQPLCVSVVCPRVFGSAGATVVRCCLGSEGCPLFPRLTRRDPDSYSAFSFPQSLTKTAVEQGGTMLPLMAQMYLFFYLLVLRIESGTLCTLWKLSATESHPQPLFGFLKNEIEMLFTRAFALQFLHVPSPFLLSKFGDFPHSSPSLPGSSKHQVSIPAGEGRTAKCVPGSCVALHNPSHLWPQFFLMCR